MSISFITYTQLTYSVRETDLISFDLLVFCCSFSDERGIAEKSHIYTLIKKKYAWELLLSKESIISIACFETTVPITTV